MDSTFSARDENREISEISRDFRSIEGKVSNCKISGVEVSNFNPMFSSASSWARVKLGMAKLAKWNLQILGILTFSIAHGYAVNLTEGFRQCQVRK